MGKFRKKPVVIEAVKYPSKEYPDWMHEAIGRGTIHVHPDCLSIDTLEGNMLVQVGDWIIRGVKGELYPCKPDIFAETYEPA